MTTLPASRKKIAKLIKKFPYFADLRVINGIQIYADISQSGLTDKKVQALENANRNTELFSFIQVSHGSLESLLGEPQEFGRDTNAGGVEDLIQR